MNLPPDVLMEWAGLAAVVTGLIWAVSPRKDKVHVSHLIVLYAVVFVGLPLMLAWVILRAVFGSSRAGPSTSEIDDFSGYWR